MSEQARLPRRTRRHRRRRVQRRRAARSRPPVPSHPRAAAPGKLGDVMLLQVPGRGLDDVSYAERRIAEKCATRLDLEKGAIMPGQSASELSASQDLFGQLRDDSKRDWPELARIMDVIRAINAKRRRDQPSSAEECQAFNKVAYAHIQTTPPTEATGVGRGHLSIRCVVSIGLACGSMAMR